MLSDLSHGKNNLLTKIVLGFVFILMLASLAFSDVRGVIAGGIGHGTVASVNGERITTIQLQREMQRIAYRMNLSTEQTKDPRFAEQVLRIMIADKLNTQGLKDLNLEFSDAQVAAEIKKTLSSPMLAQSGTDVKSRYQTMLKSSGLSEKEFVQTVRTSLGQRVLDEALFAAKLPDPLWANVEKARKDERRDILFVNVPLKQDDVKIDKVAEEWMQQFYNDNQEKFMNPEERHGRVFVLSAAQLKEAGAADTQNYLMEIEDAFSSGDDADAVAKQYKLEARPATDKELAGDLEEDLVSSAVPLEKGDYGFVLVDNITAAAPKPYDDVKDTLAKVYRQKTAYEAAQQTVIALRAATDPEKAIQNMDGAETFSRESVALADDVAPLFATAQTGTLIDLPPLANGDLRFAIIRSITPGKAEKFTAHKASMKELQDAQNEDSNMYADQILSYWYDNADIKVNEKVMKAFAQPVADPAS